MKQTDSTRFFSILAWAGIALVVLVAILARYVRVAEVTRMVQMAPPAGVAEDQTVPADEPLGELNSHCGGPLRLPCRPGLMCSVDSRATEMLGTCIKPTENTRVAKQLGESCTRTEPCVPGLFCTSNETGACKVFEGGTPRTTSLKLEGTQFQNGIYQAKAGEQVAVRVVAVNASRVLLRLRSAKEGLQELGVLEGATGGNYSGTVTLTPGFIGVVEVMADADTKGFSVLSASVEAVE